MILNELYEMVNKDLEIDKTELDTESLRTPQIHNKYLILHSKEKLKLEHVLSEKKVKRRNKYAPRGSCQLSGECRKNDL